MALSVTSGLLVVVVIVVVSTTFSADVSSTSYMAAVFEHRRFGTREDSPRLIVRTNLDYYRRAAGVAHDKGADIIVFPEYGIFPPGDRQQLKDFLETCPDPNESRVNPCDQHDSYLDRPILYTLSCIAKNNSMVVAANTGDIQNCTGDVGCPSDGVFHLNTNVVFDRDGTLLVRYHKEHLFYEFGMDLPKGQQNTTFKTDFGTFGTYICFDIDFHRMSQVAHWPSVDGIIFPTMWVDQPPQMTSVQVWQSWSLANNSTLLASNINIPGYLAVGSGIFHGRDGVLGYTFNPDGTSKVVVAKVPKRGTSPVPPETSTTAMNDTHTWNWTNDGVDVPQVCTTKLLNDSTNIYTDYRCVEENVTNYVFTKLLGPRGNVQACQNGFCCNLDYDTVSGLRGDYYLGVFNGTYDHFGRYFWCEEDCLLARCDSLNGSVCGTFPIYAETEFTRVHLRANFSSEMVYPSVLDSGIRLVSRSEWQYDKHNPQESSVYFRNGSGRKLVSASLKGRCYSKDPPYIR